MLTYVYTVVDRENGKKSKGEIEAQDEKTAAKILADRGLSAVEIREKHSASDPLSRFRYRIKTKEKVIFSRQLSTMINAGLPLVQSLNTVEAQIKNPALKEILGKIVKDVEGGASLADSLAKYPRVFSGVFTNLVAAGEASGTLDTSLERLANQQEKDAEILSKVRGAMFYPLIVLAVLAGVVGFMLTTVLPQVQTLYNGLPGAELPVFTRMLLSVSNFVTGKWYVMLIIIIVSAVFFIRWSRTPSGSRKIDHFKLSFRPIAPLFQKMYMARFARTGSTLVASGVPMIKMLNTSAEAVGNSLIADGINRATVKVQAGRPLSDSLAEEKYFLDLVPDMIRIGEQSGQLEGMMTKVADYYEREVDNQIKSISTIIEPMMMIIVGVIALVIVAAVLLPIYSLAGNDSFSRLK